MSNYITARDLEEYIGTSTLQGLATDDADARLVSAAERAEGIVNTYLAKHYETPVRPAGILRSVALALAANELWLTVPGASLPEKVRQHYTDAMTHLKRIADGEIILPNAPRKTTAVSEETTPTNDNTGALYLASSPSELNGF